jgi:branched-subunit amino acid ABC-type transport system permease component
MGLVLIYKGTRTLNFAHGETGMVAAFTLFALWQERRWPYFPVVVIAVSVSASIGWLTDRLVMRRMRGDRGLRILIATLAIASIIQFFAVRIWDADPRFIASPMSGELHLGDTVVTMPRLVALAASAFLAFALLVFFRRTTAGLTFRAVAVNPYASRLMGVNVERVSAATWVAGAVLSAIAAILVAPIVSFHVFFMTLLFIRALAAALIGGLTNFAGTYIAAVLIGVTESVLSRYIAAPGVLEALIFLVMLAILALKPRGLFTHQY